jgi:hypothetical protein
MFVVPYIPELAVWSLQDKGLMEIKDTRVKDNPRRWMLGPEHAAVIKALDDPRSMDTLMRVLARVASGRLSRTEVEGLLAGLMEKGLVIRKKKTYLSLVLPFRAPRTPESGKA